MCHLTCFLRTSARLCLGTAEHLLRVVNSSYSPCGQFELFFISRAKISLWDRYASLGITGLSASSSTLRPRIFLNELSPQGNAELLYLTPSGHCFLFLFTYWTACIYS